jgi:hypothetical protein
MTGGYGPRRARESHKLGTHLFLAEYEFMFTGPQEGYSTELVTNILTTCGAICCRSRDNFASGRPHKLSEIEPTACLPR